MAKLANLRPHDHGDHRHRHDRARRRRLRLSDVCARRDADGDTVSYGINDGNNSEVGTGVYTTSGTTLTRNVTRSTNGHAAINLSGTAQVFITPRAEDILLAAAKADQQAASSNALGVTPGVQQQHPSAAKAWCLCNFAGSALASYNVSSMSDIGSGVQTFNWASAFASANYAATATVVATPGGAATSSFTTMIGNAPTAGALTVYTIQLSSFGGVDAGLIGVSAFGGQ